MFLIKANWGCYRRIVFPMAMQMGTILSTKKMEIVRLF